LSGYTLLSQTCCTRDKQARSNTEHQSDHHLDDGAGECGFVGHEEDDAQQQGGNGLLRCQEDGVVGALLKRLGHLALLASAGRMRGGGETSRSRGKHGRIVGSIEVNTGVLIARQRSHFTVQEMYHYFRFVERRYPKAERISIALDNWPVHFHPFVLEELAKRKSRIELLPLPTYAPCTNPTEKG
jgi:hypothetical protein